LNSCVCSDTGKMRSRISILSATDAKDGVGGPITTYSALATVSANVEWKSGNEVEKQTKATAITNAEFTIWFRSDLDKKMIINFRNKVYNILSILQIGRRKKLKLITQQIEITSGAIAGGNAWQDSSNKWIDGDGNVWMW
jgi:SPP1 family predicted phage head-tail adaptor